MNNKKSNILNQMKIFIQNMPASVAMFDKEIKYIACSNKWLEDYNLFDRDIIGKSHYEIFPEIPDEWKEIHQKALMGEVLKSDEDSFINQNKRTWLKWDVRPWYNGNNEIGGIIMLTEIVTEDKEREFELDLILKSAKVGVWKYNPLENNLVWDDSMYSLYEVSRDQFSGDYEAWTKTLHPNYLNKAKKEFEESLNNQDKFLSTFKIVTNEGKIKVIGANAKIERNSKGEAISVVGINIDKTEEFLSKEELEKTNNYLDLALEGANLGIWDWWPETNVVKIDERCGAMLGLTYENLDMKLSDWKDRVHPDDIKDYFSDIKNYLDGKTKYYQNIHRMKHANGNWVYILDQGKISEWDENGKPLKFTGTHLDVTEQKQQEIKLIKARKRAEKAEKSKSIFLANMSHEIRSPMNGVLGMVDLLFESDLNNEQKEMLNIVKKSGEALLTVINDILDFSKIESNKLIIEKYPFNLSKSIEEVFKILSFVKKKNVEYKLNCSINESDLFLGDEVRVKQVLTNLISNALKFTEEGFVHIEISEKKEEDNRKRIDFIIKDTGVGIPEESKEGIFSAFTQAEDSITRRFGGTGLGLSITKYLVEAMNGEISFTSELGKGSTFYVSMNFDVIKNERDVKKNNSNLNVKINNHKILIVEDNLINQKVVSKILEKFGIEYDIASNGLEAYNIVTENSNKNSYSIVLMDMQMPVMDGVTATKKIIKKMGKKAPPIVALTANAFDSDIKKCLSVGMCDFISKPISLDKINKILLKHCNDK